VKKYKEKYNEVPDALAAMGYDAAKVAVDAMNRATDLSGPAIAKAVSETKGFEGVTGTITINEDHNAVKSAVVLGIDKNQAKYVTTIKP